MDIQDLTLDRMVAAASTLAGEDITGRSRRITLVRLRCALVRYARLLGFTQEAIGEALHRDHSSVWNLERRMAAALDLPKVYPDYIETYNQFTKAIQ